STVVEGLRSLDGTRTLGRGWGKWCGNGPLSATVTFSSRFKKSIRHARKAISTRGADSSRSWNAALAAVRRAPWLSRTEPGTKPLRGGVEESLDRKSTRLNSSHVSIPYA